MATAQNIRISKTGESEKIVRGFFQIVRSGREPERAAEFMADTVLAHQMNSENPETIRRTPQNYADHIKEFLALYGQYDLEVTELIAKDDKVYVRWMQTGKHLQDIDEHRATNLPLVEVGSAVYRIENGKIAEYWIQLDRQGFELQLQQNEKWSWGVDPISCHFQRLSTQAGHYTYPGKLVRIAPASWPVPILKLKQTRL